MTASDEHVKVREHGIDVVRVTAGLHRQVWVSGTTIFVDVHVANSSRKPIKRLDLLLERDVLYYKHVGSKVYCFLFYYFLILFLYYPLSLYSIFFSSLFILCFLFVCIRSLFLRLWSN